MKKVIFVGQAPPRVNPDRPFGRTTLYKWLYSIGITDEDIARDFTFNALINYFPGVNKNKGHLAPTPLQIKQDHHRLISQIKQFNPDIIVPVGKLSIQAALNAENINLSTTIGQKFTIEPYGDLGQQLVVIPFPHPSGASTWIYQPGNKELLAKALHLLKLELEI